MEGISSQAAMKLENKQQFLGKELQNKEFNDGTGLEEYDLGARFYDPQIGRFFSIDPLSEYMRRWSPYVYGFDNPVRFADVNGLNPGDSTKAGDASQGSKLNDTKTLPTVIITNGPKEKEPETKTIDPAQTVKAEPKSENFWDIVGDALVTIAENTPFVGSAIEIGKGIYNGDWKQITMGVVMLGVDVFTAGEGGNGIRLAERAGETLLEDGFKVAAKDEVEEIVVKDAVNTLEKEEAETVEKQLIGEACGCFLPGTLILTDSGYKRIEQIKIGDVVWSFNDTTGRYGKKQVVKLFIHVRDTIYQIHIGNEVISATADHPFFVAGRWLKVASLKVGDSVATYRSNKVAINSIKVVFKRTIVYNFEVADFHTYYVSGKRVLVHNCGGKLQKLYKDAQKEFPNKKGDQLHHVEPKYMGGPKNGKLSPIPAAYHQKITNAFRNLHPYGAGKLTQSARNAIMKKVYSKLPLPK